MRIINFIGKKRVGAGPLNQPLLCGGYYLLGIIISFVAAVYSSCVCCWTAVLKVLAEVRRWQSRSTQ
jgi:hypothetical protein